jgi:3-phosphoshikimate 1-carboxyvinyltransferase
LIAGQDLDCTIEGDASLSQRPMARVADPLTLMGANVATTEPGTLPMRIQGGALKAIIYELPVASAQVKSCVLIAGLKAAGQTTVIEKTPTRDHTEILLRAMGADLSSEGARISVAGGTKLEAVTVQVPGDFSSAAFFMAAAALVSNSEVRLPDTGVNPTRTGGLAAMEEMGVQLELERKTGSGGEPIADILVHSSQLRRIEIQGSTIPTLIDELPLLAVVASQANGTTMVRDAAELRHKETDRIAAVVANLSRLGAQIEEFEDGFAVTGPTTLRGATVNSYGDHRIAMAMAVAGLVAEGKTTITDAEVAAVSYPRFFHDLGGLVV